MNTGVGWEGLAVTIAVVLGVIAFSRAARLGLERDTFVALVRSLVQLLIVAGGLGLVIADDVSIWWSWLWVALMVVFTGFTMYRRAPDLPGLLPIAFIAVGITTGIGLVIVFAVGVFPVTPRTVVPVAGMVVGNSLGAGVLAVRRLLEARTNDVDQLETRLALGQPWHEAARPTMRKVARLAITPQIESTKALGIVFLPGAMTGLILAGVDPLDAVIVQLSLMYVILGAVITMVSVTTLAATRQLFSRDDHRLLPLE